MTGAEGQSGGIATANKNILRAVADLAVTTSRPLRVLSLHESPHHRPGYLPPGVCFCAYQGNKRAFALALLRQALAGGLVMVDHVTLSLPLLPLLWLGRCRLVVMAHGSEADDRMRTTSRWMFRLATKVLTNSELTRQRLLRRLPTVRAEACPLGLSPDFSLADGRSAGSDAPIELAACDGQLRKIGAQALLLVARMDATEAEKGHDAVLRALPRLRERFPNVQAVFPGSGSGRVKLMRLAQELRVGDAVFFPGYVSTAVLAQLYRASMAFVMPSRQEGFGLVYLEAMCFSKPCVGCRNDGAEEVIVHEETGLLIQNQSDTLELVAALERLLGDPVWARRLGEQGAQRLHERFTAEHHQTRVKAAIATELSA